LSGFDVQNDGFEDEMNMGFEAMVEICYVEMKESIWVFVIPRVFNG